MDSTQPSPSAREIEIVELVADGCSTAEIANLLYVSPNTVKTHLKNIFRKCGVQNRAELAVWWCRTSAPAELMKPSVDQHIGQSVGQAHRRRLTAPAMALGALILVTAVIGLWLAPEVQTVVGDVASTENIAETRWTDDELLSTDGRPTICEPTIIVAGSNDACGAHLVR